MTTASKSRNSLDGKIVKLRQGLAIYKVKASPFWRLRIWVPANRKRIVRTTKARTRVEAVAIAEDFFASMGSRGQLAEGPKDKTFEHFADQLVLLERRNGEAGKISRRASSNTYNLLHNPQWGPVGHFKRRDVREIQTRDYLQYMSSVQARHGSLTPGTLNHIAIAFRKVLALAQSEGVIDTVPLTPRHKRKDNPRSFFRFHPLVNKKNDEFDLLLRTAKKLAEEQHSVRGALITEELYDFVLFLVQSFMRPTNSEIYALTHGDVSVARHPRRLILEVRNGKTGHRVSNSMPAAVDVYERIKARNPSSSSETYVFLPAYSNRNHARRIFQNQFNAVLARSGLKKDKHGGALRSVYSLRHTAICMRLVLSEGKVNIFNLAKNAGTSVDQIERFYARHLPMNPQMARNLHSFGEER